MAKKVITQDRTEGLEIDTKGTWIVSKGVQVTQFYDISVAPVEFNTDHATFLLQGKIDGSASDIGAIGVDHDFTHVEIGKTGRVVGSDGIDCFNVWGVQIHNNGRINGNWTGIDLSGCDASKVVNNGLISGDNGVSMSGEHSTLVNMGRITGHNAVVMIADSWSEMEFRNSGTVKSTGHAFWGGDSTEIVRNDGRMVGDIEMGGGEDRFDFGSGRVDGLVSGGEGRDTYIIRHKNNQFVELDDSSGQIPQGTDTVLTSIDYTLLLNVEDLRAIGKADLTLTGNLLSNTITGNGGDNRLYGNAGADHLSGAAGADRLSGGAGEDIFHFGRGFGRDVIEDFDTLGPEHDQIIISGQSVEGIFKRMDQVGANVEIDLSHGDVLVIKGVDMTAITAELFY